MSRCEVSAHDTGTLSVSLELLPHLVDHLLGVGGAVLFLSQLEVVHLGLLLQTDAVLVLASFGINLRELTDEMLRVLGRSVGLLLLSNVVGAAAEGRFPVLLEQVRMTGFVKRTGARCRVSVLDSLWDLVVGLSLDVDGHFGSFKPIGSCGSRLRE